MAGSIFDTPWTDAVALLKGARKTIRVGKATLARDFADRSVGDTEQVFGALHTQLGAVLSRADAIGFFESTANMFSTDSNMRRHVLLGKGAVIVAENVLM